MTKQKTTKKATRLQTAVRQLKTGRKTDLLKMGKLLKEIKETKQYRNMEPWYSKWGLYLYHEKISPALAGRAIRAFEALQGLENLVSETEYKKYRALMINLCKTNFDILCHMTATEIADLLQRGAADWTGAQLKGVISRHQGKEPKEPTRTWTMTKKEAEEVLYSLENSLPRKGRKLLRKSMIARAQAIVSSL